MSIVIALCLGWVFGLLLGAVWRIEEIQALQKANAKLLEDLHSANNVFRTKQRANWVN